VARLVVESGIDAGMVYPLLPGQITVGRSPTNAIQIIDKRTSRVHAQFTCKNHEITVKDLGSKNGTLVNDLVVDNDHPLHNGDRILIGETTLLFERDPGESTCSTGATSSVRLVADMAWGHEKGAMEAGVVTLSATPPATVNVEEMGDATQRLRLLLQVGDAIRTENEVDPLLETVISLLFALLQPDRAFIMLKDQKSQALVPHVTRLTNGVSHEEIAVSRTIIDRSLNDRVSLLVSDALSDVRFAKSESIVIQKIRSAIVAPLIYQDDVLGVMYFDTRNRASAYTEAELELATNIANQTAIVLSNIEMQKKMIEQRTLEREMEIARDIQTHLLPRSMPVLAGYDFAAFSAPAKHVGGDYYDFLSLSENQLGVAIADVSGKGVPAAILTASVRSALQAEVRAGFQSVAALLEHLNELVYRDTASNMFVTLIFAVLNGESGLFEYGNAGHPYPLLFDANGNLAELEVGGCFLGIGEQMRYSGGTATVPPGGTLILYSDGVTDTQSPDGELFGRKRLIEVIRKNLGTPAEELRKAIFRDTQRFQGDTEQFDDFTLIIIRRA